MLNKDYLWPGLAAIALALLFPAYWIYVIAVGHFDFPQGYYANILNIDFSDFIYLSLGALEIYIYLNLKRILHDQLNYHGIDVLLVIMICNSVIFYIGLFLVDVIIFFIDDQIPVTTKESILNASYFISCTCIVVYGVMGLLIGICLLSRVSDLPSLLKLFSVALILLSLLQLTFFFLFMAIFVFPIMILILAIYFLQKPDMIEVV